VSGCKNGLILFAHGSPDPGWKTSIMEIENRVGSLVDDSCVRAAFLKDTRPQIREVVEGMVSQDIARVIVVPMFLAAGKHSEKDFPTIAKTLEAEFPGVEFTWTDVLGKWEEIIDKISRTLADRLRSCRDG